MSTLKPLDGSNAQAVLEFEQKNRDYFRASIPDRGDEFFSEFLQRYNALLDEQAAGRSRFFVLVADDGAILGRFNLYDICNGTAVVGYRVGERLSGQGVATAALRMLCRSAADLGLETLTAATSEENVASQRVLTKAGFQADGPARPEDVGGKAGTRYRLSGVRQSGVRIW